MTSSSGRPSSKEDVRAMAKSLRRKLEGKRDIQCAINGCENRHSQVPVNLNTGICSMCTSDPKRVERFAAIAKQRAEERERREREERALSRGYGEWA